MSLNKGTTTRQQEFKLFALAKRICKNKGYFYMENLTQEQAVRAYNNKLFVKLADWDSKEKVSTIKSIITGIIADCVVKGALKNQITDDNVATVRKIVKDYMPFVDADKIGRTMVFNAVASAYAEKLVYDRKDKLKTDGYSHGATAFFVAIQSNAIKHMQKVSA